MKKMNQRIAIKKIEDVDKRWKSKGKRRVDDKWN